MSRLNNRVDRLETGAQRPPVFEVWVESFDVANTWRNTKTGEILTAEEVAERSRRPHDARDLLLLKVNYVDQVEDAA